MSYQEDRFEEIANAIRQKDSTTAPIKATDFATRILAIESGGGGNDKALIERTITEYIDTNNISVIGSYAFTDCRSLSQASFPVCSYIGSYAFTNCRSLSQASFPVCSTIGSSAFINCHSLSKVSFPVCSTIGTSAFYNCRSLSQASFPVCTTINGYAFNGCSSLSQVFLAGSSRVILGTYVFTSTPMSLSSYLGYYGSIYVPASLVSSYKTATNWVEYSNRITSI